MRIEFEKSTVELDDRLFIKEHYFDDIDIYTIFPKSAIKYSKDIDFVNMISGIYCETDEEFQAYVDGENNGKGYSYIDYWDGHNRRYIDLENDNLEKLWVEVDKLEVIEILDDRHPFNSEYALLTDGDRYYIVYGCSSYQKDVYPEIEYIGKTKRKFDDLKFELGYTEE